MLDRVAAQGYAETTVGDVVAAARVSRNAFYELFADKEDCFLAAAEQVGEEMLDSLYAQVGEPTWTEALRVGLRIYLRSWRDQPRFARAYLIELPAAGRRAQEQRDEAYGRFAEMFAALGARARAEQPELPPLGNLTPRLLVTAITELVAEEIRAGRGDSLLALEEELRFFIVKALADDRTAARVTGGT